MEFSGQHGSMPYKMFCYITCFSARLFRGDYMTKRTNGIVEIYVQQSDPLRSPWYTVCADTFTNKEAGMFHTERSGPEVTVSDPI